VSELALVFLGVEWTRPLGLLALLLPAIVLWLARARPLLPTVAIGTLALWEEVAPPVARSGARPRGRISLALALLAIALTLGALALAGPRPAQASTGLTWRIVVDRSPTMYRANAAGELPIAAATRAVERWLAENVSRADRVLWQAPGGSLDERSEGRSMPSEWLRAPRIPRMTPRFAEEDRAGAWWITRAPLAVTPRTAGVCAAAIEPTHGPISVVGTTRFDWNGERIEEIPGGANSARVIATSELPDPIDAFVATWAEARGLAYERGASSEVGVALTLRPAPDGSARTIDAGRDGWSARGAVRGSARVSDEGGDLETWLEHGGVSVVTHGPGRIEIAWSDMERASGDPAAFAVSWAALLDHALLPHPAVVPLAERMASAPQRFEPPRALPLSEASLAAVDAGPKIAAWLSLAALVLALAAWHASARQSSPFAASSSAN
jgi:hypothetical protein